MIVFKKLKIKDVFLRVNHRNILSAIVSLFEDESKIYDFTVVLDKFDKIGKQGIFKELTSKGFNSKLLDILKNYLSFKKIIKINQILEILFKKSDRFRRYFGVRIYY